MDIKVFDWQGQQRDLAYLRGKYGNFIIQPAASGDGPVFEISTLREKVNASNTVVVRVTDPQGAPLQGIRVAWYWPDAPEDANAGPKGGVPSQMRANRCVKGDTNIAGEAGFGMGQGAYYWPSAGQIGPHAAWIHGATTRSDLLLGLGMVAATNQDHFDVEFVRQDSPPPTPTPPANVAASDGTYPDKVRVTWSGSPGATYYEVYRAATLEGTKAKLGSPTGTSFDDTTAAVGTTYHYWVRACNSSGCSDFSAGDTGHRGDEPPPPDLEEIKRKVNQAKDLLQEATVLLDEALALLEQLT